MGRREEVMTEAETHQEFRGILNAMGLSIVFWVFFTLSLLAFRSSW